MMQAMNSTRGARRMGWLAVALLIGMALPVARGAELPDNWKTEWAEALKTAGEEKKPVLAMFSAAWCPPCQMMKGKVLPQQGVKKELENWVAVYVDEAADGSGELIKQYDIEAFPTFVVVDAKGSAFTSERGGMEEKDFLRWLTNTRGLIGRQMELDAKLAEKPDDAELLNQKADLLVDMWRDREALALYERVAKLDPQDKTGVQGDLAYVRALSIAMEKPKEADEALANLAEAYPGHPRLADALFMRALIALNANEDEEAGKRADALLKRYVEEYPTARNADRAREIRRLLDEKKPK